MARCGSRPRPAPTGSDRPQPVQTGPPQPLRAKTSVGSGPGAAARLRATAVAAGSGTRRDEGTGCKGGGRAAPLSAAAASARRPRLRRGGPLVVPGPRCASCSRRCCPVAQRVAESLVIGCKMGGKAPGSEVFPAGDGATTRLLQAAIL